MHTKTTIKMETFSKAFGSLQIALVKSEEHADSEDFEFFRDSVIQRFEYTIEYLWKLLKVIMENEDQLQKMPGSPAVILKEAEKL